MLTNSHIIESLPAYVLGSLEQDEAQQVADHLAGCTICRLELEAYQQTADLLLLAVPEAAPAPDLKPRLMERIQVKKAPQPARTPQTWMQNRLAVPGIFAALALIFLLAVSSLVLWQRLENMEMITGPLGMRAIALHNTDNAPGASGFVIVGADGVNGVLVVDELPALDAGYEYQVWLALDGTQTSGGVFTVDEYGYRGIRIKAPQSLLDYTSVQVTIEPEGGSASPTGSPVLSGSLFNRKK